MTSVVLISLVVTVSAAGDGGAPPVNPLFESSVPATPAGQLDRLVFARLDSLGIQPVLCSDSVFLRRAYLDVIGSLPTAGEARDFLEDSNLESKRLALIDRLLERDEFADYWAMKWGDVLRIKAEFPVNLWPNAAQAYHRWVRESIAENKPYDRFVRELLTSSGSNFRVGPVNFYRAVQNRTPESLASAAALAFLGSRTDSWPEGCLAGTAVFFSQIGYKPTSEWKEENVFWDPFGAATHPDNVAPGKDAVAASVVATSNVVTRKVEIPENRASLKAVFPDGTEITLPEGMDPREVFADWLITPENPWFTKAIVNRVWAWLLGRGIIHEPDDIRDDNPPSHPELLAFLERELIASEYDLKSLYRLILSSRTYQFSSMPRFDSPEAAASFASYPLRRLDAEVLIDAINQITGTRDLYTSPIPEPFTYIPQDMPAVAIADGSITSPFLALFGRSARATGMANERDNRLVSAQWLHLLNSSHIQAKLEQGPKLKAIFDSGRTPEEITEDLYLTILSRKPTPEEIISAKSYSAPATTVRSGRSGPYGRSGRGARFPSSKRRDDWVDICWSLINSTEFLYRH